MNNRQNFGGDKARESYETESRGSSYEKWASLGQEVKFAGNSLYQDFAMGDTEDRTAGITGGAETESTLSEIPTENTEASESSNSNHTPERMSNIENLRAQYQVGLNNFINNLYDESDENAGPRDADDYTTSMLLEKVIGEEAQDALIKEHAATRAVEPSAEVYQKLSEVLAKSKYADEIANDPFLRNRRVDYLAGRYDLNEDRTKGAPNEISESDVVDLLWQMDPDFEKSDEARELFHDADYYDLIYGEPVQKQGVRQGLYLGTVQNALNSALDTGKIEVGELLNDPFLRRRHAVLEYGRDGAGHDRGERLAADEVMRRIDEEFLDSTEMQEYIEEQRAQRKEIFSEVNQGEIERATTEVLEAIPDRKFRKILKTYEKNIGKGDQLLIKTLLKPLGLGNNPPKVEYVRSKQGESGAYSYNRHLVEIDATLSEEQGMFKRINVIAHEYWHAHQYRGENVSAARRNQYLTNHRFYQRPAEHYRGYREQLLEKEAFLFGNKFESRLKRIAGMADTSPSHGSWEGDSSDAVPGPVYYRGGNTDVNRGN